jgi:hypothetical protein
MRTLDLLQAMNAAVAPNIIVGEIGGERVEVGARQGLVEALDHGTWNRFGHVLCPLPGATLHACGLKLSYLNAI